MSELKKHNSIIFLTTLSVYLGLVLVGGASSPILAQAALTRNFDIQEEIEYKDDLDKKPDEKSDEALGNKQSLKFYSEILSQFIKQVPLPDHQVSVGIDCELCRQKFDSEFSLKKNLYAFGDLEIDLGKESIISKINIKPKASELDSIGLVSQINARLLSLRLESKDNFEKIILDNTFVITENNQIFVITNLPRASIDALLAEYKANQAAREKCVFE